MATSTDKMEQFFHHLAILKEYAMRVVLKEEILNNEEEYDLRTRMKEFLAIGDSFDLTGKEATVILYKEILT